MDVCQTLLSNQDAEKVGFLLKTIFLMLNLPRPYSLEPCSRWWRLTSRWAEELGNRGPTRRLHACPSLPSVQLFLHN